MADLPAIGALWIGGRLSFLEQLCLVSFVHAGHRTVLYTYEGVENPPEGVELGDANQILPESGIVRHARTGSPALHSDLFRYHMIAKFGSDMIWADTDAYCVKPFETPTGHFFGWESRFNINGGVIGLPGDSPALAALLDFTTDQYSIPPWYPEEMKAELRALHDAGTPRHVSEMPWGVWGPHAVTHFLHQSGEAEHAFRAQVLYPVPFKYRRQMLDKTVNVDGTWIKEDTRSVHLWGRRMRAWVVKMEPNGVPRPRSFFGRLLKKHRVNPYEAPIAAPPAPEQ